MEQVITDPELLESLRRIYEHELRLREKYPDKPSWWEWEIGDVGVPPWHVVKLVRLGLVERTYASSNHKYYRLKNIEKAEELLTGGIATRAGVSRLAPGKTQSIPPDLFDVIVGHDEVKWLLRKSLKAERHHVLLVGPPATAKTLFLLEIARLPGAVFIDATHSTRVGLRELILTLRPRYVLIDEIDKVVNEDFWHGLNNIMETGIVSYSKAGEAVNVRVNVNIYATANTKRFIHETLLSRFDVIEMEPYDDETLRGIIVRLLVKHYKKSERLAERIADLVINDLGSRDVRDAIKAAKVIDSEEDLEMYRRTKLKYRRSRRY